MKTRVIVIEWRKPRTKAEHKLYGQTNTEGDVTRIFINSKQSQGESIDTFFHEIAHAYFTWMGSKVSAKQEESIARLIGNIVEPCFRRGKK